MTGVMHESSLLVRRLEKGAAVSCIIGVEPACGLQAKADLVKDGKNSMKELDAYMLGTVHKHQRGAASDHLRNWFLESGWRVYF